MNYNFSFLQNDQDRVTETAATKDDERGQEAVITVTGAEKETETVIVIENVNVKDTTVSPIPEKDRAAETETGNEIVNIGRGAEKKGKRIV